MSSDTTDAYHERILHDSPQLELGEDNAQWLAQADAELDSVVRYYRLRQQYGQVALAVDRAVIDDTYRRILWVITENRQATYADITNRTTNSKRWVKECVADLVDDGILTVNTSSNPAVIDFHEDGVSVLVEDALNIFLTT